MPRLDRTDHHLAGPLGVAFMSALCEAGWLRRSRAPRGIEVTPKGQLEPEARARRRRAARGAVETGPESDGAWRATKLNVGAL